MKTIRLTENQSSFVPENVLSRRKAEQLLRLLPSGCTVDPATNPANGSEGFEVRIDGRIGIVGLGNDTQVVIEPKIPMHSILSILQWTRRTTLHSGGPHPVARDTGPFVMRWLRIFVAEANRVIVEGLRRDYVMRNRRSMPIRGRIDVKRTVRKPGPVAPFCRFSEFTVDNPHNQILLTATQAAQSTPGLPVDIRKELGHIEATLLGRVKILTPLNALALRPEYHSSNQHYQVLHSMCRMILQSRVAGLEDGSVLTRGMLLMTDDLFEESVYRILEKHLGAKYSVHWEETKRFSTDYRVWPMKFDITIRSIDGKVLAVLDCKYKQRAHHSDSYQVVAYARGLDVRRGALVYPAPLPLMHNGIFGAANGIHLDSLVFDVRRPVDEAIAEFVDDVAKWLQSELPEKLETKGL